jgi:hypothetical protein
MRGRGAKHVPVLLMATISCSSRTDRTQATSLQNGKTKVRFAINQLSI